MSVIRGQAIRFSLINYLATGIAAISTLWIYPLELYAYGLAQFLVSICALCVPLATLGTLNVAVKFFPEYKTLGLKKSFLFNILVLGLCTLAATLVVALLINKPVLKALDLLYFNAQLIAKHKYAIVALIGIMAYNGIMIAHSSNYNKIAIPTAFQNLLPKFILPVLIIGLYLQIIDIPAFAKYWVLSFGFASIGLTWYLRHIGALDIQPAFTFFSRERLRKILAYSGYMSVGTLGVLMMGKLDLILVGSFVGLKSTGVYSIALFIGNILLIPATGIWQIAAPIISKAFEENNMDRIREVYKKSSSNLLISGIFFYFAILGSLDSVLQISPNYDDISKVVPVFALIGLTRLIDMGASVNQFILIYSSRYRTIVMFTVVMASFNLVVGYFLTTNLGMFGAAIATCITVYLYHFAKGLYIEKHFGIHPFSESTPRILLLFGIMMTYYILLPRMANPILQALLYLIGLVILYVGGIRILKIRSDTTDAVMAHWGSAQAWVRKRLS